VNDDNELGCFAGCFAVIIMIVGYIGMVLLAAAITAFFIYAVWVFLQFLGVEMPNVQW